MGIYFTSETVEVHMHVDYNALFFKGWEKHMLNVKSCCIRFTTDLNWVLTPWQIHNHRMVGGLFYDKTT